jgi:excisionase family DNA binding protein
MAEETKKLLSIKEAAKIAGVTDMYMRALIRSGRISATRDEFGRYQIEPEAVATFETTKGERRGRQSADGTRGFIVKVPSEVLTQVVEVLKGFDIELEPRFHYDPEKSKAYRIERQAKMRAAAKTQDAAADAPAEVA